VTWEEELITWKTDAWKDPRMAAWYNQRMEQTQGTNRLKNRVEVDLMARYAAGRDILDVGAGTGRASLPLAQAGYRVSAIDSSQAMLDHYRANAGDTPVTLKTGDVTHLPFGDAEFDTVLSLNVMVHFPHWRDILSEWKRTVRPGGRIVFDVHSLDHVEAAARIKPPLQTGENQKEFSSYATWVRSEEVVEAADRLGLAIVAVVPYAGVFGSGNPNHWLWDTLADKSPWERLLSWMALDERLFRFGLFLEQECFARLTPMTSPLMMVVLDKREDRPHNAAWLARRRELDAALGQSLSLPTLCSLVPEWDADWQRRLNEHLNWPRNRVMAWFLWSAFWDYADNIDLASFVGEPHLGILRRWHQEWLKDALTTHLLRAMSADPDINPLLTYRGVPLAGGLEYELTREVLTDYFHSFDS
jgi:ubiquinone/menaquinone biosynthesis C-methylase UbiE